MKKDWKVTLSYDVKHEDTYLIQNETKEDAIYIAENQNMSPKYNCKCIDEESEIYDVEDSEETTIKEVVWNSEKKEGTYVSVPARIQIPENINEQFIVELYSK